VKDTKADRTPQATTLTTETAPAPPATDPPALQSDQGGNGKGNNGNGNGNGGAVDSSTTASVQPEHGNGKGNGKSDK